MTSVVDTTAIGKVQRPRRHVRTLTGYLPEKDSEGKEKWPRGDEKVWKNGLRGLDAGVPSITKSIVNHVQTSLARQPHEIDNFGAYQAAALSVRDNLIINWNDTQLHYSRTAGKRAYYLSLEFLMGRALDNALLNLGLKQQYTEGVDKLGFNMEDLLAQERDAGLGNGGLGRLAACYLDSSASQELPVWGYGLRYRYGIFQQLISPDGQQLEAPDPWLDNSNPWELPPGDYERAVESSNSAAAITSVLYPNDHTTFGKELRLKQQYFWTAASLADIMRRFKNMGRPITEFPQYVSIQLNDTHPTLAVPELMRLLVDDEDVPWDAAWNIVTETFFFTNHTVLPEALERWPVPLLQNLLPRHMQIIFDIQKMLSCTLTQISNRRLFLQSVERKFPGDRERLARMSLIEGSRKVNGVAELHSELVRTTILKDFVEFYGISKFGNVTNGITPRRWLDQCNPGLSELITKTLDIEKGVWLKDLTKLEGLLDYVEDEDFREDWAVVKQANKERLAHYIQVTLGLSVNTKAMFDIQIKRLHEYKRQTLNILGVIHRYLKLKSMTPKERKTVTPRNVFFAGKAAQGIISPSWFTIRLIVNVARVVNSDPDTKDYLNQEVLIPASDISQHISTAGTEASGTSNMKFCLNGGLLLGTVDGANIEIAEEVGPSNVFFFGHLTPAVEDLRYQHTYHPVPVEQKSPALAQVLNEISSGCLATGACMSRNLLNTIRQGDYYLITEDFDSYIEALRMVDEAYNDRKSGLRRASGPPQSSDRAIQDYAQEYWNIESTKVE
ncbi:glycosyltransferase family 35 protein [Suillus spraguei]|nr:glycosyltransferase family 35 protein [Suillus spraguei]